jgi:hypothetical protein
MSHFVTAEAKKTVAASFEAHGSIRRAARDAGVSFGAARRILRGRLTTTSQSRASGSENELSLVGDSPKRIRTYEEAVAFHKVDLSVWRVKSWEATDWEVGMKLREFDASGKMKSEKPVTRPLTRVHIKLERLLAKPIHDAVQAVFDRMKGHEPKPSTFLEVFVSGEPHLCVVDLVDVHFGKLAWAAETGQDYDLKIAEQVYRDAVKRIIHRASGFRVAEFLMPIGSDFLHIDGLEGKTTAGTPQDVDGRIAKVLGTAFQAVVWAVEELSRYAPIKCVWVPGNHDRLLSWCLSQSLAAWFRASERVSVDYSPTCRKYHRFGQVLIGLTHGNEERHASLPTIMATERPQDWAASEVREWHIGHRHQSKRVDYVGLDTHDGVPVRTLRSLSAVDAWHYRKGYVGTTRAAEAYLYSTDSYVGHFNIPVSGNVPI